MEERNYLAFRRFVKSRQNKHRCDEHGQDGDLEVYILNYMLFKVENWKI